MDPRENRRRAYVKKIEALLPPVEGLRIHSCSIGDFSVVWAAGSWTPVDCLVEDEGATLIFGDAIDGLHSRRLNATQLQKLWENSDTADPLDGFHAAVTYDGRGRLIAGADLLGVFPVYYYTSKEAILVGSSPELFRYHPCFEMSLNPEGLVDILLTKRLVNGKTMLRGVRRLAAGHVLKCNSEMQVSEVAQYKLPTSTKYFGMSLSEQVEVLDKVLEEAVARHVPKNEKYCLMLSGGLDSTLLAGYLERADYDIVAITEGLNTDNEMKCAKQIAETLGFKHVQFHIDHNDYRQYSELTVMWQHLSDGFTSVPFWGFYRHLRKETPHVVTGFCGDGILTMVDAARTFDALLRELSDEAFTPTALGKLLKRDYADDLISRTLHKIKEIYTSYAGLEFQRIWGFGLNQRRRFDALGGVWFLSFGAWPILPFVDHKILETAGGFPIESLEHRRVERELLRIKFPKLARLALAGSAITPAPIVEDSRHKVQQQIYGTAGIWRSEALRQIRNQLLVRLRGERRYWPRHYHFDSLEWKIVRKTAEPYIHMTRQFLDEETLEELMPSADSNYLQVRRRMKTLGVKHPSSLRMILGLALWSKTHFDAITNIQQGARYTPKKSLSKES